MNARLRNRVLFVTGLAVAAFFLWLAFRNADPAEIAANLRSADARFAAPFILVLFLFYWLKADRWRLLLAPVRTTTTRGLFPIVMIGYAGSAVLPMQLGEIVRAVLAARNLSFPISTALASITVERLFDLLMILLILAAVLAAGQRPGDDFATAGYVIGGVCLLLALSMLLLVTRTESVIGIVLRLLRFLPDSISAAVRRILLAANDGLSVLKDPLLVWRVLVSSMVQWSLMGACIYLSFEAVGLDQYLLPTLTVLSFTVISVTLPTGPGYVGSIQIAFVFGLAPFGVSADKAVAASVFYHVLAYVSVLLTGFLFLHRAGLSLTELKSDAETLADDTARPA